MGAQKALQLNIRTSDSQKTKLAMAAKLKEMNLTQFILSASLLAADEVLADQQRVSLSSSEYQTFLEKLEEPPKSLSALKKLFSKSSILE